MATSYVVKDSDGNIVSTTTKKTAAEFAASLPGFTVETVVTTRADAVQVMSTLDPVSVAQFSLTSRDTFKATSDPSRTLKIEIDASSWHRSFSDLPGSPESLADLFGEHGVQGQARNAIDAQTAKAIREFAASNGIDVNARGTVSPESDAALAYFESVAE